MSEEAMVELPALPGPVLVQIMLRLGVQGRHGRRSSKALVCVRWAEAAAAATLAEGIDLFRCADAKSLQRWLTQHGGSGLRKLSANLRLPTPFWGLRRLQLLPLPQLQQLRLQYAELQLPGPGSICSALSAAAPHLTSLHLVNCSLVASQETAAPAAAPADAAALLAALAPLRLSELSLSDVCIRHGTGDNAAGTAPPAPAVQVPALFLQGLQPGSGPELTQLQRALRLEDTTQPAALDCLMRLQHLQLGGSLASPLDLDISLTGLHSLGLSHVSLLPIKLSPQGAATVGAAADALLAWLPRLVHLSRLELQHVTGLADGGDAGVPEEGQAGGVDADLSPVTALTHGPALRHLDLRGTRLGGEAWWRRAFPIERPLTRITALLLSSNDWAASSGASQAAHSCPNVARLVVDPRPRPATTMLPGTVVVTREHLLVATLVYGILQERPALTSLSISLAAGSLVAEVAQLTQLRHLHLLNSHDLHDLTALTALTRLTLLGVGIMPPPSDPLAPQEAVPAGIPGVLAGDELACAAGLEGDPEPVWGWVNTAADGSPPDVWSQLQAALASQPQALRLAPVFHAAF